MTRDVLAAVRELAGDVPIDPTPQEVALDGRARRGRGARHLRRRRRSARYFAAATRAALVLAAFRAPYRGRSTPVNAWWGSFDLAVSLFSGEPADPPSDDFIMRNSMDAQEVAVGWWPGDARTRSRRSTPTRTRRRRGSPAPRSSLTAARWDGELGEYLLDWDDVLASRRPARRRRSAFARSVVPARLRGVRLGPGAGGERRGRAAARRLAGHCGQHDGQALRVPGRAHLGE